MSLPLAYPETESAVIGYIVGSSIAGIDNPGRFRRMSIFASATDTKSSKTLDIEALVRSIRSPSVGTITTSSKPVPRSSPAMRGNMTN